MNDQLEERLRQVLRTEDSAVDPDRTLSVVYAGAQRRRKRRTVVLAAASVIAVVGLATPIATTVFGPDTPSDISTVPSPEPPAPEPTAAATPDARLPANAVLGTTGVDGTPAGVVWKVSTEGCDGSLCSRVARDDGSGWTTLRVIEFTNRAERSRYDLPPVESVVVAPDGLDAWVFGQQLWSTHDGGATWERQVLDGDNPLERVQVAQEGDLVFALQPAPVRLWVSNRAGDSWRQVELPNGYEFAEGVAAVEGTVAVATTNPSTNERVLVVSRDGGNSWQEATLPCKEEAGPVRTTASAMFLSCPSRGGRGMDVWRSRDAEEWGVLANVEVSTYVDDTIPVDDGTVLVVTGDGGLLVTTTGHERVDLGLGPDDTSLFGSFLSPERGYLLVAPPQRLLGTTDGGHTWARVD